MTSFKIGNVTIPNRVILAPMAGITNRAYRLIAQEFNVGLTFSEMISAEAIIRDNKKTFDMIDIQPDEKNIGIQLFGNNADTLAKAAQIVYKNYPFIKIIDINMGCPVPKVAIKSNSGSALLKNPTEVYNIVKKVVDSVDIPITVKIRSGWDSNSINAVQIAQIIQKAGASAISIHARTRAQGYSGKANWDIIKQVKKSVSIPVIGNGDINTCYDAKAMITQTDCDAIMIARGTLGNPWLVKDCVDYLEKNVIPKQISFEDKIQMIKKHYRLLVENKSENFANLEIRKYILFYLKGLPHNKEIKVKICQAKNKEELEKIIADYEKELNTNTDM